LLQAFFPSNDSFSDLEEAFGLVDFESQGAFVIQVCAAGLLAPC
jgi:hypothetical protein